MLREETRRKDIETQLASGNVAMSRNSQRKEMTCRSESPRSIKAVVTQRTIFNLRPLRILTSSYGPELLCLKHIAIRAGRSTLTSWLVWRTSSQGQVLLRQHPDQEHRAEYAAVKKWYPMSGPSRSSSRRRKTKSFFLLTLIQNISRGKHFQSYSKSKMLCGLLSFHVEMVWTTDYGHPMKA